MDKRKATNAVVKEDPPAVVQAEDEGHIELVLRCLASMCDGQNTVLQVIIRVNAHSVVFRSGVTQITPETFSTAKRFKKNINILLTV